MKLDELRARINEYDKQILDLFKGRMSCVAEIGALKSSSGLPVRDRNRENEILSNIGANSGDLDVPARILFETLFAQSRQHQLDLLRGEDTYGYDMAATMTEQPFPDMATVAFHNDPYSRQVVNALFSKAHALTFKNESKITDAVNKGLCDFGLLHIEDNRAGADENTYDFLMNKTSHIVRSVRLNLTFDLIAPDRLPLDRVRHIVCDAVAEKHCSEFLNRLEGVQVEVLDDDAFKSCLSDSQQEKTAFIVPTNQNPRSDFITLRMQIGNRGDYMRFICIAPEAIIYPDADRLSLLLSTEDVPGGLGEVLARFAALGINLTLLESRPTMGGIETFHRFFIDLESDLRNPQVQSILGQLHRDCTFFRFLGAYQQIEARF